jgi:5-formyltetrahydrofolate cyclo-ligase
VIAGEQLSKRKRELRALTLARRKAQSHRMELSRRIFLQLIGLPSFQIAQTIAVYVSNAVEVDTRGLIQDCWDQQKHVAVPFCLSDELLLFSVNSWAELAPRTMGILEPIDELISETNRRVVASQVDLFAVPGVAFDRRGGRLGFGKGYYDRLLSQSKPTSKKIGLAFDCQILGEVPMGPHDVFMDLVVTETGVHSPSGGF